MTLQSKNEVFLVMSAPIHQSTQGVQIVPQALQLLRLCELRLADLELVLQPDVEDDRLGSHAAHPVGETHSVHSLW